MAQPDSYYQAMSSAALMKYASDGAAYCVDAANKSTGAGQAAWQNAVTAYNRALTPSNFVNYTQWGLVRDADLAADTARKTAGSSQATNDTPAAKAQASPQHPGAAVTAPQPIAPQTVRGWAGQHVLLALALLTLLVVVFWKAARALGMIIAVGLVVVAVFIISRKIKSLPAPLASK